MEEGKFWELIERLDWSREGDDDAVVDPVISALSTLEDESIFAFDDILASHLHELDTRDIAVRAFGSEDLSPDEFLYWRCVCVANGESLFRSVLSGRQTPSADLEFEALLYTASSAWARKHNTDSSTYPHVPEPDYETYANSEGWTKDSSAMTDNEIADSEKASSTDDFFDQLDWNDFLRLAFIQGKNASFSHIEPKEIGMLMGMRGERVYSYLTIFLGPIYWAYRRCYLPAFALLAVFVGVVAGTLALGINPRVMRFLPGMIAGAFFYRAYRWRADMMINRMNARGICGAPAQEAYMREHGGTSIWAALGMGVLYIVAAMMSLAPIWMTTLNAGTF